MIPNALRGAIPARPTIDDPRVSLTDFALALETGLLTIAIARRASRLRRLKLWCVALFGAATVASLAGGIDHGFMRRAGREVGHDIAWMGALLAIGASSLSLVATGAELGLRPAAARRVIGIGTAATGAYALVVLLARRDFLMAILAYVPAALFFLWVLTRRYLEYRDRGSRLGIVAILLGFAAAAVQRLEIGIRALGHNTLYHLIQAISFRLLFASVRELLEEERDALEGGSR